MLDLGKIGIRIARIHQRIEVLGGLPDASLPPLQRKVLGAFSHHEIQRLVSVILAVKLSDAWIGVLGVVAELFLGLARPISPSYKIIPLIQVLERLGDLVCSPHEKLLRIL
jgi:hypothetical protein